MLIEILGYVATVLVAGSFLLSSVLHLRIVNSIGSSLYAVYGALIDSFPVVLLNVRPGVKLFFFLCRAIWQIHLPHFLKVMRRKA